MLRQYMTILMFLLTSTLNARGSSPGLTDKPYEVNWMSSATSNRVLQPASTLNIYCYTGTAKTLLTLWQTTKFHIKIQKDDFSEYVGRSPEEVFEQYTQDSYGWSVTPFQRKPPTTLSLELYNVTCLAIKTKQNHTIELQISRIDAWRLLLMCLGLIFIFSSRALSGNPFFFYLCGILIGICASFMVLVFYVSKLLPRKTFMYGVMIGGWTVGIYVFQQIWENMRAIIQSYQNYLFWYTSIVGFISFLFCYRIGPPKNKKSQNMVMWTLQVIGVVMIFFSSEYQEAAAAVIIIALILKHFFREFLQLFKSYWYRKFPPKPKLLSNEEYYEEGVIETRKALENLKNYCSSPDCPQWRVMLKLNDTKRFASFIEGNSHLSDEEILNYDAYAFSDGGGKRRITRNSNISELDISDDDSSDSEEDL